MVLEAVHINAAAANKACHCEERSDVAIRIPLPGYNDVRCAKRRTDCHTQCAHWVRNDSVGTGGSNSPGAMQLSEVVLHGRMISAPTGWSEEPGDCHASVRTGSQ